MRIDNKYIAASAGNNKITITRTVWPRMAEIYTMSEDGQVLDGRMLKDEEWQREMEVAVEHGRNNFVEAGEMMYAAMKFHFYLKHDSDKTFNSEQEEIEYFEGLMVKWQDNPRGIIVVRRQS